MADDPRQALFERLERAVARGDEGEHAPAPVTPSAVALVWSGGATLYHEGHGLLATHGASALATQPVHRDTRFDLASLTKPLVVGTLAAIAHASGLIDVDAPIGPPWDGACPGATWAELLRHEAGLIAHAELFAAFGERPPFASAPVIARALSLAPAGPRGHATIYSDLGFMVLGAALEQHFGRELDDLVADRLVGRCGLHTREPVAMLGYRAHRGGHRGRPSDPRPLAPTGREARWLAPTEVYDPPPWPAAATPRYAELRRDEGMAHGTVHDDNAWAMGGVAGHAGLFGTAYAVLEVARGWLEGTLPGIDRATRDRFLATRPGTTRRLGWDGPSPDGTGSTGTTMSEAAFGHLGFTGTSVWVDPHPPGRAAAPRIVVLLTARVHPRRGDDGPIRALRRDVHQLAAALCEAHERG
jgi:CubicO group peptidase (beta-lactamase class C family)